MQMMRVVLLLLLLQLAQVRFAVRTVVRCAARSGGRVRLCAGRILRVLLLNVLRVR